MISKFKFSLQVLHMHSYINLITHQHKFFPFLALPVSLFLHILISGESNRLTVVCLVTCPMNASEAGRDLPLVQTSAFLIKYQLVSVKTTSLHKSSEVCIKTRSPGASLPFKCQVTEQTTFIWPVIRFSVWSWCENYLQRLSFPCD